VTCVLDYESFRHSSIFHLHVTQFFIHTMNDERSDCLMGNMIVSLYVYEKSEKPIIAEQMVKRRIYDGKEVYVKERKFRVRIRRTLVSRIGLCTSKFGTYFILS
jgi:hypothetical protein